MPNTLPIDVAPKAALSKPEYRALTSMRGVAALGVCVWHIACVILVTEFPPDRFKAYLFVDFFFVLSGFVLTHAYGQANASIERPWLARFYVDRLSRIYPLHVFTILLLAVMEASRYFANAEVFTRFTWNPFHAQFHPKFLLTNLTLIHAWGVQNVNAWNFPSWSISCEFFCYLIFPFVFFRAKWPVRRAIIAVIVAGLALPAFIVWRRGDLNGTFDYGLLRAVAGFTVGCMLGQYRDVTARWMRGTLFVEHWQLLALAALFVALLPITSDIFIILASAFTIASLGLEEGRISQWLAMKWPHYLGEISYSIYLVHVPVILSVLLWFDWHGRLAYLHFYPWATMLALTSLVLLVSVLTYHFVEMPAKRIIRKRAILILQKKQKYSDLSNRT